MKVIRPHLIVFLAGLMILTSQSMAVARGVTQDVAGQMVICTGSGPMTVLYDADGAPVEAAHACPDCALHFVAVLADTPNFMGQKSSFSRSEVAKFRLQLEARSLLPFSARAPPTI